MKKRSVRQSGFSLLELLVVVAVFSVITGVVFQLLNDTQNRYRTESAALESFQDARLALDQMARDIHTSGYPPANQFTAAVAAARPDLYALPFGFSPNYPAIPGCAMGVCATPNQWDVIVETDVDPESANGVEWIRYRLNGNILERGSVTKTIGGDPLVATNAANVMVPFVENVMNNGTVAQMTQIRTYYPAMFPGNTPVPLFTYLCQVGTAPIAPCTAANNPRDIREVNITIIVQSPLLDLRNRQPRVMTLTGRARRINPSS